MISLIKPFLVTFITSRPVKQLIIELLEILVKRTDNPLDDVVVSTVRSALLP